MISPFGFRCLDPRNEFSQVIILPVDKPFMKYILLLSLLSACAQFSERAPSSVPHHSWRSFLSQKFGSLENLFEGDGKYLDLPWRQSVEIGFETRPPQPSQLQEVQVQCKSKELWPTHPQQFTKEYLYAVQASFERMRLPPHFSSCITPNPTRKYCLMTQTANVLVVSDTYQDNCGNYYRAYWHIAYRTGGGPQRSEDHMGTMLSRGRTQYEKPNARFKGEYDTGYTYPVKADDFLFLSKLLPSDQTKISRFRSQAIKQGFTMKGKSFTPPKR